MHHIDLTLKRKIVSSICKDATAVFAAIRETARYSPCEAPSIRRTMRGSSFLQRSLRCISRGNKGTPSNVGPSSNYSNTASQSSIFCVHDLEEIQVWKFWSRKFTERSSSYQRLY